MDITLLFIFLVVVFKTGTAGFEPATNRLEVGYSIQAELRAHKGPPIFIDPMGREGQDLHGVWTPAAYESIILLLGAVVNPYSTDSHFSTKQFLCLTAVWCLLNILRFLYGFVDNAIIFRCDLINRTINITLDSAF